MPRQDVPYGGAICRLRERIAEIFDKLGEKLHTINGVPGDGDGNVKIVSGSSAVVINNDPTQNEIEIALDSSQLPAASVSSVNGQTGAVALDAGDIPTVGGDVQADLQDLANDISGNTAAINAEVLARQGADATLQTNINAVSADIAPYTGNTGNDLKPIKIMNGSPVTVTNDLVDTASAQTVGGAKTFSAQMLATGQRAYAPGNTTDVATIGTLDAYTSMVRTTGNQTITGSKTYTGYNITLRQSPVFACKSNGITVGTTPSTGSDYGMQCVDSEGNNIGGFTQYHGTDNVSQALISVKAPGTDQKATLHLRINADGSVTLFMDATGGRTTTIATLPTP